MMNVDEIAACSDRLECLIFGMGDYSASQQMQLGYVGVVRHGIRQTSGTTLATR